MKREELFLGDIRIISEEEYAQIKKLCVKSPQQLYDVQNHFRYWELRGATTMSCKRTVFNFRNKEDIQFLEWKLARAKKILKMD